MEHQNSGFSNPKAGKPAGKNSANPSAIRVIGFRTEYPGILSPDVHFVTDHELSENIPGLHPPSSEKKYLKSARVIKKAKKSPSHALPEPRICIVLQGPVYNRKTIPLCLHGLWYRPVPVSA
jgi:hypothetical protein